MVPIIGADKASFHRALQLDLFLAAERLYLCHKQVYRSPTAGPHRHIGGATRFEAGGLQALGPAAPPPHHWVLAATVRAWPRASIAALMAASKTLIGVWASAVAGFNAMKAIPVRAAAAPALIDRSGDHRKRGYIFLPFPSECR
jgi:hypothetical protein